MTSIASANVRFRFAVSETSTCFRSAGRVVCAPTRCAKNTSRLRLKLQSVSHCVPSSKMKFFNASSTWFSLRASAQLRHRLPSRLHCNAHWANSRKPLLYIFIGTIRLGRVLSKIISFIKFIHIIFIAILIQFIPLV